MAPKRHLYILDDILLRYMDVHRSPAHWTKICDAVKFQHKFMRWQSYARLKALTKAGLLQRTYRGYYAHRDYENVSV